MRLTRRTLRWLLLAGSIAACEVNPQPPIPAAGETSGGSKGAGNGASAGGYAGTGLTIGDDPSESAGGEAATPTPPELGEAGEGGVGGQGGANGPSVTNGGAR